MDKLVDFSYYKELLFGEITKNKSKLVDFVIMFLCRLNPSRISISIGSPLVIKHGLLENPPFIWVNYNMSLT